MDAVVKLSITQSYFHFLIASYGIPRLTRSAARHASHFPQEEASQTEAGSSVGRRWLDSRLLKAIDRGLAPQNRNTGQTIEHGRRKRTTVSGQSGAA